MQITSASSVGATSGISSLDQTVTSPPPLADADDAGGVKVGMSHGAQLFSQLAQLAKSDPSQFKAVAKDISDQLTQAASGASGQTSGALKNLASKFSNAAESGNASDIFGQGGGRTQAQGHHHRHHAAAGGEGGESSGSSGGQDVFGAAKSIIGEALSGTGAASGANHAG